MKTLLASFLLLVSLIAQAQVLPLTVVRIYRSGDQVFITDSTGTLAPYQIPKESVNLRGQGNDVFVTTYGVAFGTYSLTKFRNQANSPHSLVSPAEAIRAFNATASTPPTVASIGVNMPTSQTYVTSATIVTTNAVEIIVENLTANAPTVTYANVTIPMQPREQRRYYLRYDPTSGKYIPIGSLVVNAAAGSMVAVTTNPKQ